MSKKKKTFGRKAWERFIENLLSVKVWIIFTYIWLSFTALSYGLISGDVFATTCTGMVSIVLAIREGIKIQKIKTDPTKSKDINV